ncbi:exo-alpha-sialidase [Leptospira brenneri]|uniref:Exo-alpha-sialidase n=1 Tax=Leptospira brenneri TaxID=2023182 RepID=A0A5F1Z3B7_9LEPT|nr:sialidase family protein [Leptospira brenneri]TGK91384.1 exo-alpha-sialidase [Leptospira brenneri]
MLDKQKIRLPILSLKLYFISLVYLIFTYNCNPNQNTSRLTDVIKIILLSNAISTCEDDPLLCTLSEFQSAPATELNEWLGLQYANGQFVAVASDGTNQVMRSTDGKSWSPHSASANAQWRSITYGNGIWVVVSNNGQRLMTSHDGIVWTNRIVTQENYTSVKFANGKFIAVSTGTTWAISIDGITWTNINSPSVEDWNDLIYGNGIWVAVSGIGSRKLATSSDNGITWTTHHSPDWLTT